MKSFLRSASCVFLFVLLPSIASASPVIRTGENISLKDDQAVSGDFYVVGGTVTNSATVTGDAYYVAGTVTQNGPISSDLAMVTGRAEVHAPVGDDVRVVGGEVVIAGKVGGDVVVVGGELTILSTAEIEGDVIFYGGQLTIEGAVKGSVLARAETVRIDARIGKDTDISARNELVFGAHADVGGDVTYSSRKEIVRALDSVIVGTISRDETRIFSDTTVKPNLFPILVLLFTGLVARFVLVGWLTQFFSRLHTTFGYAAFAGFAGLVLTPVIIILTFVSVLGAFIGAMLLFFFLFLLALSWGLAGVFLGGLISRYATGKASYSILWITLGTILLYALTFIPYIGDVLGLLVVLVVFGGFIIRMYERYR